MTASFSVRPHAWCTPIGLFAVIGPSRNRNSGAPARSSRRRSKARRRRPSAAGPAARPRAGCSASRSWAPRTRGGRTRLPAARVRSGRVGSYVRTPCVASCTVLHALCIAGLAVFARAAVTTTTARAHHGSTPGDPSATAQDLSDRQFVSTAVTGHELVDGTDGRRSVSRTRSEFTRQRRLQHDSGAVRDRATASFVVDGEVAVDTDRLLDRSSRPRTIGSLGLLDRRPGAIVARRRHADADRRRSESSRSRPSEQARSTRRNSLTGRRDHLRRAGSRSRAGSPIRDNGGVGMRTDCKHYESRTYQSGDIVRKCRIDLAPEAPWKCPDDCPGYERRMIDAGWQYGSLADGAGAGRRAHRPSSAMTSPRCSTRPRAS